MAIVRREAVTRDIMSNPRRHRFHSLCPYFAMFPERFAETWISRLTKPGDRVLDPFCGRGTTPFQSVLMGREAIACDINPVASCVSKAKTNLDQPPGLGIAPSDIGFDAEAF